MQWRQNQRSLFTEEHHQFTLVFEALTSFLLTVHEPSVVAVTQVHVAHVGGLRTIHLITILHDHVWVSVTHDTWIGEADRLISS